VVVPHKLDFSDFMLPEEATAVHAGRFVLVLRAAVCHRGGESVHSGHYVAVASLHEAAAAASGKPLAPPQSHSSSSSSDKLSNAAAAVPLLSVAEDSTVELPEQAPEVEGGWLLLDDLNPQADSYVQTLTSPAELSQLFGKELALHAYMLFYEVIDAREAGGMKGGRVSGRVLAGLRESSDLALAQQLHESESSGSSKGRGEGHHHQCPVS
jgi:hypothetical protein